MLAWGHDPQKLSVEHITLDPGCVRIGVRVWPFATYTHFVTRKKTCRRDQTPLRALRMGEKRQKKFECVRWALCTVPF